MIICVCNAIRESEIKRAIAEGATCAEDAFDCFGCSPRCGKCVSFIEESIENA